MDRGQRTPNAKCRELCPVPQVYPPGQRNAVGKIHVPVFPVQAFSRVHDLLEGTFKLYVDLAKNVTRRHKL